MGTQHKLINHLKSTAHLRSAIHNSLICGRVCRLHWGRGGTGITGAWVWPSRSRVVRSSCSTRSMDRLQFKRLFQSTCLPLDRDGQEWANECIRG